KALGYARNSLQQAEKNEDPFAMGSAWINMATALKDEGLTDESLRYTRQAYAIGSRIPDSNMMETALINIGDAYPKSEDPDKYIPAFRRAQPLARALDDVNGQAIIWQGLAEGEYWKGNYAAAEQLLQQQAIPFAANHGQREVSRNLLLLLSDVEIALGRPKASVEYRRRYDSLSQALINRTMLKNIQELETKYQVERQQHDLLRKDLLLEQKDKQAIRQRSWLIVAVTGVLLLAALFIGTWSYFRQRQQLQLRAMEALQAGQENLRLRATLEGQTSERQRIGQEMHDDMGSGLTSLLFLSRTLGRSADAVGTSGSNAAGHPDGSDIPRDPGGSDAGGSEAGGDPSPDAAGHPDGSEIARAPGGNFAAGDPATIAKIRQTAEQLIRKMNEIVWTLNHEQDTLGSLVAYIRSHAAELLEQAGIDVRFDIAENIPDMQLTQEFRRNIYLAVKEAVHNIVRHSGAGVASINIHFDAAELTVIVQDNGRGIYKAGGNRWGNGMKNMQHRVEQVGGRMEITAGGGTSITIIAPLTAAGDPSPIDTSS
ncbi:MAG: hypothetical protein JST42_02030, partial [Bacteroidetes bacterium]|nr:hypothetical protein [Bacteroidota bacterium]